MSRYYTKTKGDIPKKMYINQRIGYYVTGPYFTNQPPDSESVKVEYILCEKTGNYIRTTPFVKNVKGAKKKLDI